MTVSEFVNIIDKYCIDKYLPKFIYKGESTYLYKLKNVHETLNNISFTYKLKDPEKEEFTIESYTYDLCRLDKNDRQLYDSLYIDQPEGLFHMELTININ